MSDFYRRNHARYDDGELERQRQAEIEKVLKLKRQGLDTRQIATRLGCSTGKVRFLLQRAEA